MHEDTCTCSYLYIDGFSPFPMIVTYFPEEIDDSNLPPHWDIAASLLPSNPTVILDVKTGEVHTSWYALS